MLYFAWCGPNEAFSAAHLREDEIVFAFDIAHQEGQIPTLSVDVKNPHIGLLAPGRAQWAWLSYQSSLGTYPLFYGRLVALPTNLLGETVTLEFIARPNDFLAQKQAIANSLMVAPYYDPIWIDVKKLTDPDTVLETYAMTWHVDRVSHAVSISDILFGSDGTEDFRAEDSFYDSVSISFAQSPQTQVVFDGSVRWTQAATGVIPMPDVSLSAWNGAQIVSDWPKVGDQLHHGWSVEYAAMTNWSDELGGGSTTIDLGGGTSSTSGAIDLGNASLDPAFTGDATLGVNGLLGTKSTLPTKSLARSINFSWQNQDEEHHDGDTMSINQSAQYDDEGKLGLGKIVSHSGTMVIGDPLTGTPASASVSASWVRLVAEPQVAPATAPTTTVIINVGGDTQERTVTVPSLFGQLWLRYELSFDRTENLYFVMNSDIQPMVLLPPDEPVNQIKLSMSGSDVGLPLDYNLTVAPIGDPSRSAFFNTDRGLLAMQYPMLVARAHLAQSARATKVSFDCTFERALNLSCRKNALLHDPRLPGGQVVGKITEYHLVADGDKGELIGQVQIESTIGKGTSITRSDGTPIYVNESYVVPGYQFYTDTTITLPTGDANVIMPLIAFDRSQMVLPLTFGQAVLVFQVHQGTPIDVVLAGGTATADPTWLEIALAPVTNQKFVTNYDLGISTVVLPKLIDLAAANA